MQYVSSNFVPIVMANSDEETEADILEATGDKFFECVEKELRTSIPTYVKNILKMNGFYNAFMMSKLVESKISAIEEFMRNDFADFMIPKDATMTVNDYLGVYSGCQNKFKFLCGHKTLLEIMADTCRVYYPSISAVSGNKLSIENFDEDSKNEIFQKLFDGVANWLKSQKKFEQILQLELNFIISCEPKTPTSDDVSYSMKCPVPSCLVDKSFSVIWKSYARSTKKKNSDVAPKLCQPRWFFCSLKNHFQKCHLDGLIRETGLLESDTSESSNGLLLPMENNINCSSTSANALNQLVTTPSTCDDRIDGVLSIQATTVIASDNRNNELSVDRTEIPSIHATIVIAPDNRTNDMDLSDQIGCLKVIPSRKIKKENLNPVKKYAKRLRK